MNGALIGQQLINGFVIGLGYALIAIGISLVFRVLDAVNVAHGDLYMLGGYFTFVVLDIFGVPYVVAALVSVVLSAIVGYVILRVVGNVLITDRFNTLLATFALSMMLSNSVNAILGGNPKPVETTFRAPLEFGQFIVTGQRLVLIIVGVAVIFGIQLWLQKTVAGKQIRAVAENLNGARVIGIDVPRVYQIIFVGASALAGLAGALLCPITQVSGLVGFNALMKSFVVLILGGSGNVVGAAIGGPFLGIVESLATTYVGGAWKDVFGYGLVIIVLLIRPQGLFGSGGERRLRPRRPAAIAPASTSK